jgi:hypothetical protein
MSGDVGQPNFVVRRKRGRKGGEGTLFNTCFAEAYNIFAI